jgi:Tfp pilus assembly protein PilN
MRNIDSSQWLADPSLQIVETRTKDATGGASFTLFANQRRQVTADEAAQAAQTGKPRKKVAAK